MKALIPFFRSTILCVGTMALGLVLTILFIGFRNTIIAIYHTYEDRT